MNYYDGFVDPSGGSSDSFAMAIAHATDGGKIVIDGIWEKRPPFSPSEIVAEFSATLKGYHIDTVRGDRYSGEWVVEAFRECGVAYEASAKPKSELYAEFLALLNSGKVSLPRHPRLIAQLMRLERRISRGGKEIIDHPVGSRSHDDLSNVCAGVCCLAAAAQQQEIEPWVEVLFLPAQPSGLSQSFRDKDGFTWHKLS